MLLRIYFGSRGDWAKEILKGFFSAAFRRSDGSLWTLVAFKSWTRWEQPHARATWEHCVLATSFLPLPVFCLLFCCSFLAHYFSDFSSSGHSRSISISGGYNKGFTLCFKKIIFFFIVLLKCFYWNLPRSSSFAPGATDVRNDEMEHAWTISLSALTLPLKVLYFVSLFNTFITNSLRNTTPNLLQSEATLKPWFWEVE